MKHSHSAVPPPPCSRTRVAGAVLYGLFLLAAAVAGRYRYRMMESLALVHDLTRSALQLHTMALIQDMEVFFLDLAADHLQQKAQQESMQAQRYYHDSQVEHALASREEMRAVFFEHVADEEQVQADRAKARVQHDEALYENLIANMTAMEQETEILRQKTLEPFHDGLCASALFSRVCNAIDGAMDLQRHADRESLAMHQELLLRQGRRKERLSRRKFMDELVAQSLQQEATHYKDTSQHLFAMASHFQNQSQVFLSKARNYNESAEYLFEAEEEIEQQEKREEQWEAENMSLAEQRLLESQHHFKIARRCATIAAILAFPAILFFSTRAVVHAWCLGSEVGAKWIVSSEQNDVVWSDTGFVVAHGAIFLTCLGLVRKFLVTIDDYKWGQRSAIVAWFSFLAALAQVLSLYVLPHVLSKSPSNQLNVALLFRHGIIRLLSSFLLFGIEFLILWVTCGPWMVTVAGPVSHWMFRISVVLILMLQAYLFEPEPLMESGYRFDDMSFQCSTLGSLSNLTLSWDASEATPLTGTVSSLSTMSLGSNQTAALAFVLFDFGSLAEGHGHLTVQSASSFLNHLQGELCRLHLPFEILVTACATKVLVSCFSLAWRQAFVIAAGIIFTSFVAMMWLLVKACMPSTARTPKPGKPEVLDDRSTIELQHV